MKATVKEIQEFFDDWDKHASGSEQWIYDDGEEAPPLTAENAGAVLDLKTLGRVFWSNMTEPVSHPYLSDGLSFETAFKRWRKMRDTRFITIQANIADEERILALCRQNGLQVI